MGYSAKIKIDSKRVKKDGTAAIFMQVLINRKKARIDLDISWPPAKFNEIDLCRSRMREDPDVQEYNVIIGNARTKANSIHKDYLLRGLTLTLDSFLREFRSNLNKNDFIQYFAQMSYERWNKLKIGNSTYDSEKGTLKRLREFKPNGIPFYELSTDWAREFDNFLKKASNDHNTRWGRHKHVITYLNMAKADRITFTDPYGRFKNTLVEGSWKPLELNQMKTLIEKYLEWRDKPVPLLPRKNGVKQKDTRPGLTRGEIVVLRRFLFSCNCALRISDLQELDRSMFSNGEMSIIPKKTDRYGTKITAVPLNDVARLMLDDELADNPGGFKVFDRYREQSANRLLKRIAVKSELGINLHNHVARYTFASLMDQAGANHTGLMKYMGLRKRETLEKYVKTNSKVIAADIGKMNELIKNKTT